MSGIDCLTTNYMARELKILKNKSKVVSTFQWLMKYTNLVNEVRIEKGYNKSLVVDGIDGRDVKSMSYIFLIQNPNITDEEFKAKTRAMYEAFLDDHNTLSKEELAEKRKPYLDMLFEYQANYKKLVEEAKHNNYLGLIVYCLLSQTFGTKKDENPEYFKQRNNTCNKVRDNDVIERRSLDFVFDLTDDVRGCGVEPDNFIDVTIRTYNFLDDDEDITDHYKIAHERENRLDEAALKALDLQDINRDYLELDVIKDIYDFSMNIENTYADLSNEDKTTDLTMTCEHIILKIIGEDTNEKMLNKTLFNHDTNIFTHNFYIDGKPLDDYVPEDIKNMNILKDDGKVDENKKSLKNRLITKSKALVILKAIESGEQHIDLVRMNSHNGDLGYQIQPIKLKYNKAEYETAHHYKWWQRWFGWGVKNIQKTFDSVYNDNTQEERFKSISKHFEATVRANNPDVLRIGKFSDFENAEEVIQMNQVKGVQKDIEELKDEYVIVNNYNEIQNDKELSNDDFDLEIK